MWILLFWILVIWVIFAVDGKTISQCGLVLHAVAAAVCQLYLALLHLRHAAKHCITAHVFLKQLDYPEDNLSFYTPMPTDHTGKCCRKAAVCFLESACLFMECLCQCLAVVTSVFAAVGLVLQAALFLVVSTTRWMQNMLLYKQHELEEWEKEQKKERNKIQEQRSHVEKYINNSYLFTFTRKDESIISWFAGD